MRSDLVDRTRVAVWRGDTLASDALRWMIARGLSGEDAARVLVWLIERSSAERTARARWVC